MVQRLRYMLAGAFAMATAQTLFDASTEVNGEIKTAVYLMTGSTAYKVTDPVGFSFGYSFLAFNKALNAIGVPQHARYNEILAKIVVGATDMPSHIKFPEEIQKSPTVRARTWDI